MGWSSFSHATPLDLPLRCAFELKCTMEVKKMYALLGEVGTRM